VQLKRASEDKETHNKFESEDSELTEQPNESIATLKAGIAETQVQLLKVQYEESLNLDKKARASNTHSQGVLPHAVDGWFTKERTDPMIQKAPNTVHDKEEVERAFQNILACLKSVTESVSDGHRDHEDETQVFFYC